MLSLSKEETLNIKEENFEKIIITSDNIVKPKKSKDENKTEKTIKAAHTMNIYLPNSFDEKDENNKIEIFFLPSNDVNILMMNDIKNNKLYNNKNKENDNNIEIIEENKINNDKIEIIEENKINKDINIIENKDNNNNNIIEEVKNNKEDEENKIYLKGKCIRTFQLNKLEKEEEIRNKKMKIISPGMEGEFIIKFSNSTKILFSKIFKIKGIHPIFDDDEW
jgi:hypothetical protein